MPMYYPTGSTHSIVPAAPGWYVAWPWLDNGTKGVTLDVVIAWMIVHGMTAYDRSAQVPGDEKCCHVNCYPITADGVVESDQPALKDPDGQFIRPEQRSFANEAEFLESWNPEPLKKSV
jgi:hypothetical protein